MFCIPRLEDVYTISFYEQSDLLPPCRLFYNVHSLIGLCILTSDFNYFKLTELQTSRMDSVAVRKIAVVLHAMVLATLELKTVDH